MDDQATVRFFIFPTGEINRIHHCCSVGTEKSQPKGPPIQLERDLLSFLMNGGHKGWDFFWNALIAEISTVKIFNSFSEGIMSCTKNVACRLSCISNQPHVACLILDKAA